MTGREQADTAMEARLTEAAMWRVHLTEIEATTTLEFENWHGDPLNAAAWTRLNHVWTYLGDQAHEPQLIAARQVALGHAKQITAHRNAPVWRRMLAPLAAVLLLGLVGVGGYLWSQRPDDYKTVQGERRIIMLADGSKISLDANSEVTVRYTKTARQLHLLQGQARFDVAHDVERPFSVVAGNQKVIATGTAFNIDMVNQKILVTLIEGHVVVVDEDRHVAMPIFKPRWPSQVELSAGQQLAAVPAVPPAIESANIQRVTAWTNGQIVFDNEELSSVVARVNRYTSTRVVIGDPKVATMRISGVLNAGDLGGFVDIVTQYLPVRAAPNLSGEIELQGQAKS